MADAFEAAYRRFMERQIEESHGERRRRLEEVERHAEKLLCKNVWWPMAGSFEHVEAEWEVPDWKGGYRYLDHAFMPLPFKLDVEVEGFGVHAKNADRRKFEDDHLRAAFLQAEGWEVVRFSYDTVKERPYLCRQVLQLMIGKRMGADRPVFTESERAVIRMAIRKQGSITPGEVSGLMGVCHHTARRWLQGLAAKGAVRPASGAARVRSYELCAEKTELFRGLELY